MVAESSDVTYRDDYFEKLREFWEIYARSHPKQAKIAKALCHGNSDTIVMGGTRSTFQYVEPGIIALTSPIWPLWVSKLNDARHIMTELDLKEDGPE